MITGWPEEYDLHPHVIYALDQDFRIVRCNRAWDTFALENNGSGVKRDEVHGQRLFHVIPRDLSPYYCQGFETAKQRGEWQHVFDCSSARVMRRLSMTVTPFGAGFLTRTVTLHETLAPSSERDANLAHYGSVITLCCHCRRVWNQKKNIWQWVPEFIEQHPVEVRARLCPKCYAYHYPKAAQTRAHTNSVA